MYKKDWLINQIESTINLVAQVFLHKNTTDYQISTTNLSDEDLLYITLKNMVDKRQINEAENLLFNELTYLNENNLSIAVNFYSNLNHLDDDTLEQANYSRDEITQGFHDIMKRFGINVELS